MILVGFISKITISFLRLFFCLQRCHGGESFSWAGQGSCGSRPFLRFHWIEQSAKMYDQGYGGGSAMRMEVSSRDVGRIIGEFYWLRWMYFENRWGLCVHRRRGANSKWLPKRSRCVPVSGSSSLANFIAMFVLFMSIIIRYEYGCYLTALGKFDLRCDSILSQSTSSHLSWICKTWPSFSRGHLLTTSPESQVWKSCSTNEQYKPIKIQVWENYF